MELITVEQYLLLKNTLNLQLSTSLQKLNILYTHGNVFGVFEDHDTDAVISNIKELNERLKLLDKCVKKNMSFMETAVALEPFILLKPR